MTNIIGIIQARMGSSRVSGKAMVDLAGKPLIGHMIDRMRRVKGVIVKGSKRLRIPKKMIWRAVFPEPSVMSTVISS